jgi:hypothetical protein
MVDDNSRPTSEELALSSITPRLMAVVEVDKSERVYCAQPGCHHTVYKAIHVVKEGEKLVVLGSTCFQKRYGSLNALGKAQHWGGNGKLLTSEERALLAENTQALLARFEAEEARLRQEAELKHQRLPDISNRHLPVTGFLATAPVPRPAAARGFPTHGVFPWPWMKPGTSVAAFKFQDGSGWVRVQHKDTRQFIVPWPIFDGWDESLPPVVGHPNMEMGGYEVTGPVPAAITFLRDHALAEKVTGVWGEVVAILGSKPSETAPHTENQTLLQLPQGHVK